MHMKSAYQPTIKTHTYALCRDALGDDKVHCIRIDSFRSFDFLHFQQNVVKKSFFVILLLFDEVSVTFQVILNRQFYCMNL